MKSVMMVLVIIINKINSQVYTSCKNNKHIALTFDDGPLDNTINIVRILDSYNIKATFFINAVHILRKPSRETIIKNMYNNGHLIGTHGFSHGEMPLLNDFNKLRELYDNELMFRKLFNKRPYFYRPPYYSYNDAILNMLIPFGYLTVTSNIDTNDWKATNATFILNEFKRQLINNTVGYIVLQHDRIAYNNNILRQMINYGIQKGYTFVPLDTCLQINKRYEEDNKYTPNLDFGLNV